MFAAACLLFMFAESPIHAGIGRGVGGVDLPIQRERVTQYPMIQASGLKGCLRSHAGREATMPLSTDDIQILFGPEQGGGNQSNASDHAGALAFGDARLLLFPIRSLAGVVAWATSVNVLARFQRDATLGGKALDWDLSQQPDTGTAWVHSETSSITIEKQAVVLEEFSFTATPNTLIDTVGNWVATNALPKSVEYKYWRENLPKKLCILPEDDFRDFVRFATEIQTHIKLNPDTKTVDSGALWTNESLPIDSLFYSPIMATASRKSGNTSDAVTLLTKLRSLPLARIQLGGDETTGQGIMAIRFTQSEAS